MRPIRLFINELLRAWRTAIRYPLEALGGIVILWLVFMGIFYGAQTLSGSGGGGGRIAASFEGLAGMVLGYALWFFAVLVLNRSGHDMMSEASAGTLEQLALGRKVSLLSVTLLRALATFVLGLVSVSVLLVLIMASTGTWITLPVAPALLVTFITVAGLTGIGLVLGGLAIVFKRIGQVVALTQFVLLFVAITPPERVTDLVGAGTYFMPLTGGIKLLSAMSEGTMPGIADLLLLTAGSLVYLAIGALLFNLAVRLAKYQGLLGHY